MTIISSTSESKGEYNSFLESLSKLSDDDIVTALYKGAIHGDFNSPESRLLLKNWVNKSATKSVIKTFAEQIYESKNPQKSLKSLETLNIFTDRQKELIAGLVEEPVRALSILLLVKKLDSTKMLNSCIKTLSQGNTKIERLKSVYNSLLSKGNISSAIVTAHEIIDKLGNDEESKAPYLWFIATAHFNGTANQKNATDKIGKPDYEEAVKYSLLAIKANPIDLKAQETAFNLLIKLGNEKWQGNPYNPEAIQHYLRANKIDPGMFGPHIPRVLQYYLKEYEYANAANFFKSVYLSGHDEKPFDKFELTKKEWSRLSNIFKKLSQLPHRKKTDEEKNLDARLAEKSLNDKELAVKCAIASSLSVLE